MGRGAEQVISKQGKRSISHDPREVGERISKVVTSGRGRKSSSTEAIKIRRRHLTAPKGRAGLEAGGREESGNEKKEYRR